MLRGLRRSPSGAFDAGEVIDPEWICYLMGKSYTQPLTSHPKWLPHLKPLLSGVFTADNMDYVLRDAYMCGGRDRADRHRPHHLLLVLLGEGPHARSRRPAGLHDVPERPLLHVHERLLPPHHARGSTCTSRRSSATRCGSPSPTISVKTFIRICVSPSGPCWRTLRRWHDDGDPDKRASRRRSGATSSIGKLKWRMCERRGARSVRGAQGPGIPRRRHRGRSACAPSCPSALRDLPFEIDMALQDPRPLNPLKMGDRQISCYDS